MQARKLRDFTKEVGVKAGARKNLDLRTLLSRIDEFEAAGRALNIATTTVLSRGADFQTTQLNRDLIATERSWLRQEGIPGREWFKHALYAARYTYAHLELPGLTEAVEKADWKLASEQVKVLERATERNTELLKQATVRLSTGAGNESR
jgi:N-acetylated-alpha-linked acidic dipeptidase